jgi:SAM-dependent methyltransferase
MVEKIIDKIEGINMTAKEFFSLLWVNFVVGIRNTIEFFKVAFRYYRSWSFLKADVSLRLMYFFQNPYKISKRFLMKRKAEDIYAYGETPLTSLEIIAKQCGIREEDCVYELGCGRGRTCFWLKSFIGCQVIGLDYIPEFIECANLVKNRLGISKLEFRLADMTKDEFKGATVCYLYGSNLEDNIIQQLVDQFSKLPSGTKIITVSYPLTAYNKTHFELMKRFTVTYTWGEADVFLQIVK